MVTKLNKTKMILVIFLLIFQQYGCRTPILVEDAKVFPSDPLVDKSFTTGQPCEAPCWYNLHLETSTVNDIRVILATLPFVDLSKTLEQKISKNDNEIMFLVYCIYGEPSESCAYLQTSPEGKLIRIYLIIYYSLTLDTVIEKLGKPTYYISEPKPSGDICQMTFYWFENSIVAHADSQSIDNNCSKREGEEIQLDMLVHDLVYGKINPEDVQQKGFP